MLVLNWLIFEYFVSKYPFLKFKILFYWRHITFKKDKVLKINYFSIKIHLNKDLINYWKSRRNFCFIKVYMLVLIIGFFFLAKWSWIKVCFWFEFKIKMYIRSKKKMYNLYYTIVSFSSRKTWNGLIKSYISLLKTEKNYCDNDFFTQFYCLICVLLLIKRRTYVYSDDTVLLNHNIHEVTQKKKVGI